MNEWVTCLDVAAGRGQFAAGRGDGVVVIADLATGQPLHAERLHSDRVSSVVFEGGVLWSAAFDGQVAGWDLDRQQQVQSFDAGHGKVLQLRTAPGLLL